MTAFVQMAQFIYFLLKIRQIKKIHQANQRETKPLRKVTKPNSKVIYPCNRHNQIKNVKMQNSSFEFHNYLSFQLSKFAFCHFSLLSFKSSQFSHPLTQHPYLPLSCAKRRRFGHYLIFNIYFIIYFLIKKMLI